MNRRSPGGSALIITLAMLSLITILLVGFALSVRSDLGSSASHLDRVEADLFARMGLDAAQAQLASATGPAAPFWATRPGEAMTVTNGTVAFYPLSSGTPAAGFGPNAAVDFNLPSYSGNGMGLLTSATRSILASWVYVNQDGSCTDALPAYNAANPVVGRFAYWVDDESAKVNLNTAWTRTAENPDVATASHPSRIELAGLLSLVQGDADAVHTARSAVPNRFFNSLLDARRAGGGITNALASFPFSFTAYNHSPDDAAGVSMIGTPRLVLTTQAANANGSTNFLDILATPNTDPGTLANLNTMKVVATVNKIYGYLTNTSWPIAPGKSFAAKYHPTNPARAIQLALDIVEYVRSAESTNLFVEPIRGDLAAGVFAYDAGGGQVGSFFGTARGPRVTEIGAYFSPPYTAQVTNTLQIVEEVYLPPCGVAGASLSGVAISTSYMAATGATAQNGWANVGTTSTATLSNGQYLVVQYHVPLVINPPPATAPEHLNFRPYLQKAGVNLDFGCLALTTASGGETNDVEYFFDFPAQASAATISSVAVEDPMLNKNSHYWIQGPINTFGGANPARGGVYSPQQDTDDAGNVTAAGISFPAPKGTAANPYGAIRSLAELGHLHTGIETCSTNIGTPWRTLRLQPQKAGAADLPDWALLDLFAVPAVPLDTNVFTHPDFMVAGTVTNVFGWGGRVNLNGARFTDARGNALADTEIVPLQALFLGASNSASTTLTAAQAAALATNVATRVLANAGGNAGLAWGTSDATNFFFSPAQLAEVKGVADGGEASEAVLADVLALAAVRGNVFSVYTVGQSLKQDARGNLHVRSERRFQNIMERWTTSPGAAAPVSFQPVFTRTLTP